MAKAVNNLVHNSRLDKEKLKAFIPLYRIIKSGIVKDIPQHFDEADLLKFFNAPCKVVEVKRLNKCVRIDGTKYIIPSCTVCLKFAGDQSIVQRTRPPLEALHRWDPRMVTTLSTLENSNTLVTTSSIGEGNTEATRGHRQR